MLEPRPVDWGGGLLGTGIMIGNEDQRPVPPSSHYAGRALPTSQENNNNMTFRRMHNEYSLLVMAHRIRYQVLLE